MSDEPTSQADPVGQDPRYGVAPATPLHVLSPAEQVVAAQLCQGLSNREIAAALGKSEATVKNQVSAILRKLRVPTRMRLISLLHGGGRRAADQSAVS